MSDLSEENFFPGPAPKLDPVRDMEPIRMGDLNFGHRGLAIQASIKDQGTMYGRITQIEHGDQFSKVKVRWRGKYDERTADPDQVIRIEATP